VHNDAIHTVREALPFKVFEGEKLKPLSTTQGGRSAHRRQKETEHPKPGNANSPRCRNLFPFPTVAKLKVNCLRPNRSSNTKGGNGLNGEDQTIGFKPDVDLARAREGGAVHAPLPCDAPHLAAIIRLNGG